MNQTPIEAYLDKINYMLLTPEEDPEVALWVSFDEDGKKLHLNVYSQAKREYTHKFDTQVDTDIDAYLDGLESEFNVSFPEEYRTIPKQFIAIQNQIISVYAQLAKFRSCETCGDGSSSTVEAYYVPAIGKEDASLYMAHEFTCYDNPHYAGTFTDLNDEVLDYLKSVKARDGYSVAPVTEFVAELEQIR